MTYAEINLHRQPGDLDPDRELHGSIGLHGDKDGIIMRVGDYRTSWSMELTAAAAANLAHALLESDTVAFADIGIGKAVVDTRCEPGLVILMIQTPAAGMDTQMTKADAAELARNLAALVELDE